MNALCSNTFINCQTEIIHLNRWNDLECSCSLNNTQLHPSNYLAVVVVKPTLDRSCCCLSLHHQHCCQWPWWTMNLTFASSLQKIFSGSDTAVRRQIATSSISAWPQYRLAPFAQLRDMTWPHRSLKIFSHGSELTFNRPVKRGKIQLFYSLGSLAFLKKSALALSSFFTRSTNLHFQCRA